MQLELLVPREWRHESKEFLKEWYGRRGYRLIGTGTVEDAHPHLAPLLGTPCGVTVYEKPLGRWSHPAGSIPEAPRTPTTRSR